jgi:hypothetical protein
MQQKDANNHTISDLINGIKKNSVRREGQRLSQEQLRVRELCSGRMQRASFERRKKNHDWIKPKLIKALPIFAKIAQKDY